MSVVFLTAIGVGGATVIGALIGFLFRGLSHKFSNLIVSFAAGIMLSAAVLGLILPSIEYGGDFGVAVAVLGILVGGICINLSDRLVPHIQKIVAPRPSDLPTASPRGEGLRGERPLISRSATASPRGEAFSGSTVKGVLLFVIAIGIHNLPEGLAAGVSFGTDNVAQAMAVAIGIALQNIPEGMIIIAPLLSAGMSRGRTLAIAMLTGLVEVVGTLIGYFAVSISTAVLPFFLAFAGGIMLYIISDEMLLETHHDNERGATYSLLAGFCLMLVVDVLLG